MARTRLYLIFLLLFTFFVSLKVTKAQYSSSYYLVSFKNKNNSNYSISNPKDYLSERAINRRKKANIPIDSTDLPVNTNYIDTLINYGAEIKYTSKWLNSALIYIDDSSKLIPIINSIIVDSIRFLAPRIKSKKTKKTTLKIHEKASNTAFDYSSISNNAETYHRIRMIELNELIDSKYTGEGIQIAVLDNGFLKADKMKAFSHLFQANHILGSKNFTTDGKDVFQSGSHGSYVLSTMGGYIKNKFTGSAIEADYYLFQTEDNRYELPIEEVNWLIAAEYADSLGVNIITSSLSYSRFDSSAYNYNQSQLNGETAIVSQAAEFAAAKGILVFISAGNEGGKPWQKIGFPADADNILSVGSIDKDEKTSHFSSRGYSADKRIKPDITAIGEQAALINTYDKIFRANGTSFSNPFMAGAAATLMQATNNTNAMQIRDAIIQSARQFDNPDSLQGYGIPNMYLASILLNIDTITNVKESADFIIAPNPFQNKFHILFNSSEAKKADFEIYDISGKIVFCKKNVPINQGKFFYSISDLQNLSQSVYFINITIDGERFTKKIVKY